jgi:hypothetical protein
MQLVWFSAAAVTTVPAAVAFGRVVPRDDAELFRRHLGLPGVSHVTGASGAWNEPGRHRRVHLDDGGGFREDLTRFDPPAGEGSADHEPRATGHFDYTVSEFSGPLAHLVSDGRARWEYRPHRGGSLIRWSYGYRPLPGRRLVVRYVVGPLWRSYMRAGLTECVRVAEGA